MKILQWNKNKKLCKEEEMKSIPANISGENASESNKNPL